MTAKTARDNRRGKAPGHQVRASKSSSRLLPALLAGSACGLIAGPSSALQLGDLEVQSALGQPLRASIAFALSPNEQLFDYCIALKSGISSDGLPMLSRASVSVANGNIMLTGSTPLREPMLAMQIAVNCNYTANLTRSYTIMLDPARPVAAVAPVAAARNERSTQPVASTPTTARNVTAVRASGESTSIPLNSVYWVQVGDTLSRIGERLENRPIGLWPAVNVLFAENPDAFINGDIDRLKAGSQLTIPHFDDITVPTQVSNDVTPEPVAVDDVQPQTSTVYSSYEPAAPAVVAESATLPPEQMIDEEFVGDPIPLAGTDEALMSTVQPGDISVGDDAAFVSPIGSTASTVDRQPVVSIPEPLVEQSKPVVPAVISRPTGSNLNRTNDNWSWMFWLAGSGMALILGLLLFGRKIQARFGGAPSRADVEPVIQDDDETARNEVLSEVDFEFRNAPQDGLDFALDADLGAGTGLNDSGDIDVAQDFGFSTVNDLDVDLDLVLPEVAEEQVESHPTDIIPPQRIEAASILDEEVLPSDDGTYDMSMIIDATKQDLSDDVSTEKDLKAIPVDIASDATIDGEFTLNESADLDTLEQDYEDEFTATQAANKEIEKAAAQLALRISESPEDETTEMQSAEGSDDAADGKTAEMPSPDVAAEITSEVTAQMPGAAVAENEEFSEDTGFHDALTAHLPGVEIDETSEMEVESGRVNTKESAG